MRSIAIAALAILCALAGDPALAARRGHIDVTSPWSRATPVGAPTAVGFVELSNHGALPDRLIAADSPAAHHTSLHQMSMTGGIMRMRPVVGGLDIAPGETLSLNPSGDHLMFEGLKRPFRAGDRIPAVLLFKRAGTVRVEFLVR